MKLTTIAAIAIATTLATIAQADSRIDQLCGSGHINEASGTDDVKANPDGYYVSSLSEQVRERDHRIILTNDTQFHLCTRQLVTPASSTNEIYLNDGARAVKYLFVPIKSGTAKPSS